MQDLSKGKIMANSSRDRHRSSVERSERGRSSSRSRRGDGRQRSRRTPTRTAPSSTTHSRRGTLTRPDTGYTLHSRRVRRDNGQGILAMLMKPRVLVLVALILIVVIALVVGISSCVRGNGNSSKETTEEARPVNEQDKRVAAGVSAAMTSRFTEALDQGEQLAKIAANADKYEDERLLNLALTEPDAIAFVANYPKSDKSSRPYDGSVKRGEVPLLYDWDSHWGAITYGDGPVAITGSGPTTLAMAYMGLTGKTDNSPTEITQQASKSNYAGGDSGSKAELFSKLATSLGLQTEVLEMSADTLLYTLGDNTVIAVELKEGTVTDDAHWALVVNVNSDGSVTLYDPTSSAASTRPWDPTTIADASSSFYSITISDEELEKLESDSESDSSSTSSTRSDRSSSTSSDEADETDSSSTDD